MSATATRNGTKAEDQQAHASLWEALCAFQAEAPTLAKNAENPHFKSKFTPLDTIVETIKPLLAKHGLTWTTRPSADDEGRLILKYQLVHAPTGEKIEDAVPLLLSKQDAQGAGSAITYFRRYTVTAVLNLVADEDDDGNQARAAAERAAVQRAAAPSQSSEPTFVLAPDIVEELVTAKQATGKDEEWVRQQLVAVGLSSVPSGKVTLATIKNLTEQQAMRLLERFEGATEPAA